MNNRDILSRVLIETLSKSDFTVIERKFDRLLDAALSNQDPNEAFPAASSGKQLDTIQTLRDALLVAQISLILIEIAKAAKTKDEFEQKAAEEKKNIKKPIGLDMWQKLLSKISQLVESASKWS